MAYRSRGGVLARVEGMIEAFIASELLAGGVGLGFATSAMMLAIQSRQRAHIWLALLSFLQAGWCIASYGYLYEARPALALAWARVICIVAPFILAAFAALVVELVGGGARPWWYRAYWLTNLGLTTVFCVLVVLDGLLGTELVLGALEIVLGLHAHPERGRGAEISGEAQRSVGGNAGLLIGQTLDTSARYAHRARDRIRREVHRTKEFLA